MYMSKSFGEVLEKDNDKVLFDILVKVSHIYTREEIYEGVKGNIARYGLKPIHTEYNYLDKKFSQQKKHLGKAKKETSRMW